MLTVSIINQNISWSILQFNQFRHFSSFPPHHNYNSIASGLFKQHELMKSSSTTELYIRQATPETYRQVLKEIRQKEIFKIIVDTNPHYINRFLRAVSGIKSIIMEIPCWCWKFRNIIFLPKIFQILQLQMNDYRYHFMFTTFVSENVLIEISGIGGISSGSMFKQFN